MKHVSNPHITNVKVWGCSVDKYIVDFLTSSHEDEPIAISYSLNNAVKEVEGWYEWDEQIFVGVWLYQNKHETLLAIFDGNDWFTK